MSKCKELNKELYTVLKGTDLSESYPVKVLQIGDGNFIRSFIDWMFCVLNQKTDFQGKVVTVQALPEDQTTPKLNKQDGYYTLLLKGIENGQVIEERNLINSIERAIDPYTQWDELLSLSENEEVEFLFSNTTEAGIAYTKEAYSPSQCPKSYPGKVTSLLYHRYQHFKGLQDKGWIILPCELIENNGDELKRICIKIAGDWNLEKDFIAWVQEACVFCNTLVDRIVPGYPKENDEDYMLELGYQDKLLTIAEPYHFFVIEGPEGIEKKLPFKHAGLNVQFDRVAPYRELKVKLLNGTHTILSLIGLLMGIDYVREGIENKKIREFLNKVLFEEIIAAMQPDVKEDATDYVQEMFDRFGNPFIEHGLADISLNSYAKFKTRVWPSIYDYKARFGKNPNRLVFVFASLLYFYSDVKQERNYKVNDSLEVIAKFKAFDRTFDNSKEKLRKFVKEIIDGDFHEVDENADVLIDLIVEYFLLIKQTGMDVAITLIERRENE